MTTRDAGDQTPAQASFRSKVLMFTRPITSTWRRKIGQVRRLLSTEGGFTSEAASGAQSRVFAGQGDCEQSLSTS